MKKTNMLDSIKKKMIRWFQSWLGHCGRRRRRRIRRNILDLLKQQEECKVYITKREREHLE